jgi:hypothetical protein
MYFKILKLTHYNIKAAINSIGSGCLYLAIVANVIQTLVYLISCGVVSAARYSGGGVPYNCVAPGHGVTQ